jgi:hypothetical protein
MLGFELTELKFMRLQYVRTHQYHARILNYDLLQMAFHATHPMLLLEVVVYWAGRLYFLVNCHTIAAGLKFKLKKGHNWVCARSWWTSLVIPK